MEPLAEILRNFSSLESLRLSGCLKGQACFLTVGTAVSSLQHLKTLDLSGNDCGDALLAQIATGNSSAPNPHLFQHLTSLNLSGNRLGADACQRLQEGCFNMPHLHHLELGINWLKDEGLIILAAAIADARQAPLTNLLLPRNGIGAKGATALGVALERGQAQGLRALDLNINWIGPQGAGALANSLRGLPFLGHLALSENELRSEGAMKLSEVLQTCLHLTSLDLSHNGIGPDGVLALASQLPPRLVLLDLSENALGDAGCAHLAALVPTQACSASITKLDLRINDVSSASEQGLRQLVARCPRLSHLDLRGNDCCTFPLSM